MKLNEKKLEPSIDMMINEFEELSNEIDEILDSTKELEKEEYVS